MAEATDPPRWQSDGDASAPTNKGLNMDRRAFYWHDEMKEPGLNMSGRLEWPDPTPDGPTAEEERQMDEARECQTCDGSGRVSIYYCKGRFCECGHCPDVGDCPECVGKIELEDIDIAPAATV